MSSNDGVLADEAEVSFLVPPQVERRKSGGRNNRKCGYHVDSAAGLVSENSALVKQPNQH